MPVLVMRGFDVKGNYFFRSFYFLETSLGVSFPVD